MDELQLPKAIVTSDDVCRYLNIDSGNIDSDTSDLIDSLIRSATSEIEAITLQPILPATVRVTFEGNGSSRHTLKQFPVIELQRANVTEYNGTSAIFTTLEIDTDIRLVKIGSIYGVVAPGNFQAGLIYEIEILCGYTIIPENIRQTAVEMVAIKYKESDAGGKNGRLGVASIGENSGQGFASATTSFKDEYARFRRNLIPYRIPIF